MIAFPQPAPKVIHKFIEKEKPSEVNALHKLLTDQDKFGSFTFSAEYVAMSLTAEGYKISVSTIRSYRRTSVNNPFKKE